MPIRCVLFTASAEICEHNDAVRALNKIVSFPQLLNRSPISQQIVSVYARNVDTHVKLYSNAAQMNPEKRSILPGLAFKGFSSRYQRPALSEGFQDITEVAFKVSSSHGYMHDDFRSDKGHCSSMEMKQNVIFGVGTGLKNRY